MRNKITYYKRFLALLFILLTSCTVYKAKDKREPDDLLHYDRFNQVLNCGIRVIHNREITDCNMHRMK